MFSPLARVSTDAEMVNFYKLLCDKMAPEYQRLIAKAKSIEAKPPNSKNAESARQ